MARSTYIYAVFRNGEPTSAFTVKHELATWLKRNPGEYRIFRIGDGVNPAKPPVEITDEFIERSTTCTITTTQNGRVPLVQVEGGQPLFDVDCSVHGRLTTRNTAGSSKKIGDSHETEQVYQQRFGMSKEEYEKEEAAYCAEFCLPDEDTPKVVFGEVKKSGARKPTRSTKDWS